MKNLLKIALTLSLAIAATACVQDDLAPPTGDDDVVQPDAGSQPLPACSDGRDNDGDSKVDSFDPGCHTDGNAGNAGSYMPSDNNEVDEPVEPTRGCRGAGGFLFENSWRQVATVEKWNAIDHTPMATLGVSDYTLEFTNAQMPWAGRIRYYAGGPLACAMTANDSNGQNVGFDVMTGIWDWRVDHEVNRWYKTGCNWLPFHNTRERGLTWDFNCGEAVFDVSAPIVLPQ